MAQSAAQLMDLTYEPLAIGDVDTMLYLAWEQNLATDQPSFPGSSKASDGNVQQEYKVLDFVSNYTDTPTSTNLAGSIFSQEYPTPPRTSELTSPEVSPGNSDGRQRSPLRQSNNRRKRKLTRTKRDPTKSYGRDSSKQVEAKGATGDARGDMKRGRTINKAAERNLSSLQHVNSEHNRKRQERNRRASNKFRNKKREDQRNLESAEKNMEQVNHDLSICATDLKSQVYNLKMKLLQHTNCDCALIQEYIANNANRYIQDLEDERQCQQL